MSRLSKVTYTAEATVDGGRRGHARTPCGRIDVALDAPVELQGSGGPGTNPEQLFAAGYAACFHSALLNVARKDDLDLRGSTLTAYVSLGPATGGGGMMLEVALDLHAPDFTPEQAGRLLARADEICPYSKAVRGNVEVALRHDGVPIARAAA